MEALTLYCFNFQHFVTSEIALHRSHVKAFLDETLWKLMLPLLPNLSLVVQRYRNNTRSYCARFLKTTSIVLPPFLIERSNKVFVQTQHLDFLFK